MKRTRRAAVLALLSVLALAAFASALAASAASPVAQGYLGGHKYALYETNLRWGEAVRFCERQGGHLATITSREENDYLYRMVADAGVSGAYFGYTDEAREGAWAWVTGEDDGFQNWHEGEPNDQSGVEDYAMFYWKFTDGTWNDGDYDKDATGGGTAFLCEWETTDIDQHVIQDA